MSTWNKRDKASDSWDKRLKGSAESSASGFFKGGFFGGGFFGSSTAEVTENWIKRAKASDSWQQRAKGA